MEGERDREKKINRQSDMDRNRKGQIERWTEREIDRKEIERKTETETVRLTKEKTESNRETNKLGIKIKNKDSQELFKYKKN